MMQSIQLKFILCMFSTCVMLLVMSCTHHDRYQSSCNVNQTYQKLSFKQLMQNPAAYNGQYVEVRGKYVSGKDQTALSDSATLYNSNKELLWIDFSPQCPLYQQKTHKGLFEDYSIYKKLDGKLITFRGQVNTSNHGYQHQYKAALEQISLLEW